MPELSAIAISALPDDIEFTMAGTLLLLRAAGYRSHDLTVSTGSCGSLVRGAAALRKFRRREGLRAAAVPGAQFHGSHADDVEIVYSVPRLRALTAVLREVHPTVVLTHPPQDYMEDHTNTCRLAVMAAFSRGAPNFTSGRAAPRGRAIRRSIMRYRSASAAACGGGSCRAHLSTPPRCKKTKLAALARHESRRGWLQATQQTSSYLQWMEDDALGKKYLVNRACARAS